MAASNPTSLFLIYVIFLLLVYFNYFNLHSGLFPSQHLILALNVCFVLYTTFINKLISIISLSNVVY